MIPTLLLVAHGTRDPAGLRMLRRLAAAVARSGRVPVRLAFADVLQPDVGAALSGLAGPVVAVPAFLAAGYHVRLDVPAQVAASGRGDVLVTQPLGADPVLTAAAAGRLREAGLRDGDAVVMAAAGSSDPRALADVDAAARGLGRGLGAPVHTAFLATARPRVADVVAELRDRGSRRVAVASWLLAPGVFHGRATAAGADVVADPLGLHPAVVAALLDRYDEGLRAQRMRPAR